jgi:RES domain-containing protein
MRLWRISDFATLSGDGGLMAPGSWHSQGQRIVYLADHPGAALVELLARFQIGVNDIPDWYQLLAVDVPETVSAATLELTDLPPEWRQDPPLTRSIGDRWLSDTSAALLRVPSAIVHASFNWLLNPLHPDAASVTIAEVVKVPIDPRLLGLVRPAETPAAPAPRRRAPGRSPHPSGGRGRRRKRK